ncbi:MAG: RNA 2',3'-cyclic phosphodiesterase [Candidatus Dormibacteraeota bacterium]|uniref:RNA 2',3'-cyclic phosphodiesterase n=1 Tax=Candidatus Dormiibacter inghamiae TaxID=3127013 RepID=A0A934NDH7_9BACT|nr:RNA 2',3'-cyclic phosphodiesterase [Candidatus Dormibacteraeota bacterium]
MPVPPAKALATFLAAAREAMPGFRWVEPQNLHLTLRFLGYLDETTVARLITELSGLRAQPFELGVSELGIFGGSGLARVVWLGVRRGAQPLIELAAQVEDVCRRVGLPPADRQFRAHVTLARARDRRGAPLGELPPVPAIRPWPVREVVLFQSRPRASGANYLPIFSLPLRVPQPRRSQRASSAPAKA